MMQISRLRVDNFKSLVNFEMSLAKFNCLVGLNGTGKSTVLQFFDFMSQQVKGDMKGWLKNRQWQPSDINSRFSRRNNIEYTVELRHDNEFEIKWIVGFNRNSLRCTSEQVVWNNQVILRVEDGKYSLRELRYTDLEKESKKPLPILFDYQGSILSQLKESQLTPETLELKRFFEGVHSLDLLAPELLRQRARNAGNSLGLGGERLSAFLYELGEKNRNNLVKEISKIYPQIKNFEVSSLRVGWKKLFVQEEFTGTLLKTEARHVADGFLRILAIFAQLSKSQSFLLLDEIENGINPEIIEFLMDYLVQTPPQILVTTHSPLVLNYLEDDIALKGVIYLYKKKNGATRALNLFNIPSMKEKLTVMGAGEVYEDTLLTELYDEISTL